jgi:N-acetylmuramic acid 6-phosphate etherase
MVTTGTESLSRRFAGIDEWSTLEVLKALHEGQLAAVAAVGAALPALAGAVEAAASLLERGGGRLIYAGAGTSARVAVQDGVELPPTFDWPQTRIGFAIAGSEKAMWCAIEGAEDSEKDAILRVQGLDIGACDVVIGVAASGTTPYTVAAIAESRRRGALTIGVANNAGAPLLAASEHPILVETGEEVIGGSTRMKAGTAQKVVLNLFSTAVMVRLGRVYKGMMVDFRVTNAKLRRRSEDMVAKIAGCDAAQAKRALGEAEGEVKLAALIALGARREDAQARLRRHGGNLRLALREMRKA